MTSPQYVNDLSSVYTQMYNPPAPEKVLEEKSKDHDYDIPKWARTLALHKEKEKLRDNIWTSTANGLELTILKNDKARKWVSKSVSDTIDVQELFSPTGFPMEVLKQLDENAIKAAFQYGVGENLTEELNELIESNDTDGDDEE